MSKQLKLSSNKMLTGTAAGLAEYIGLDPTLVRVIFAVCVLGYGVGLGVYLIIWLVMLLSGK